MNDIQLTEYERWMISNGLYPWENTAGGATHPNWWSLRNQAICKFSFAILDKRTVEFLRQYGPFLEVGAGLGYWAWELRRAGIDTIATDPKPYSDTSYLQNLQMWDGVEKAIASEAITRERNNRTLLMCWPSLGVDWPRKALRRYFRCGGRTVAYIGEGRGGCTADDAFFRLLGLSCRHIGKHPIPRWFGLHDHLQIWQKK